MFPFYKNDHSIKTAATAATSPSNPLDTLEALPVNGGADSVVVLEVEVEVADMPVVVSVKPEAGQTVVVTTTVLVVT